MLSIRRVRDEQDLRALGPIWNPLLERSSASSIFLTWEWLSTWWRHYRAEVELCVLVAEEQGELVGLAPLMIGGGIDHLTGPARTISRQIRFLKFLSQGASYPEHMDFICQPGREAEVTEAFVRYLAEDARWSWDILSLDLQRADSPCREPMLRALAEHKLRVQASAEQSSPYLALPSTREAFWESRSASFKKKWRYNDRALAKLGKVRLQLPDSSWPVDRIFDEMLRLNDARWGDRNQSFVEPRFVAFHRELCHLLHARGWLLLCLLTLDDRPVAARYDFIYGGKAWSYQGGWSQELAKLSVGNTFLGHLMEHCIGQGLTEYDFLTGEHAYKRHWSGGGERPLVNLVVSNPYALRGWVYVAARQAQAAARQAQAVVRDRILPSLPERIRERLAPTAEEESAQPEPAVRPGDSGQD